MFEIRKCEQKPVVMLRLATVQELAAYEKWKQEKDENLKVANQKRKK